MPIIALIFATLAAICAFLITYIENEHHYPPHHKPIQLGLQAAVLAFLVFFVLALFLIKLFET